MTNDPMTLIERLRNPAFETNPSGGDALLSVKQTRADMEEAADLIGAIKALIIMAGCNERPEAEI